MPNRVRYVRDDHHEESAMPEIPAGPNGRPLPLTPYKRGGTPLLFVGRSLAPGSAEPEVMRPSKLRTREQIRAIVRRVIARLMRRYRSEGRCDERELRIIESLFDGVKLREVARRERLTAARVSQIVNNLASRATEFYRWWHRLNLSRRMGAMDRGFRSRERNRALRRGRSRPRT